jgi:hypothetical protein
MNYLVVDIETVPNERAEAFFAQKSYEPAANLKDPEKIAASIASKRHADIEKAALYWWTGKIVCISANDPVTRQKRSFAGKDERDVIKGFFDFITKERPHAVLTGKQTKDFDFPYLVGRALALDIGIPQQLRISPPISDVNLIFGFSSSSSQQRTSLANYAWGLEIQGKSGHGSNVKSMFDLACIDISADPWRAIREYCEQDTEIVAEMLRRYSKSYEATIPTSYSDDIDGTF